MARLLLKLPYLTPWVLFILFSLPLFFSFSFRIEENPDPFEIKTEEENLDNLSYQETLKIQKGIIGRYWTLKEFYKELESFESPQDGQPESILNQTARILFSHKLLIGFIVFLLVLCISSYISLMAKAWFAYPLSKTLHWIGYVTIWILLFQSIPHIPFNVYSAGISIGYGILYIYLFLSSKSLTRIRKEFVHFDILKHNPEFDEDGKKHVYHSKLDPVLVAYHFGIIILVGLLVGNAIYIPLFVLQKHFSREFGILIAVVLILLSMFYIRNYKKLSEDPKFSSNMNLLVSFAFLQYRFIRNIALGIGITILVIVFVTILFSILLLNSELLNNPDFGLIEKSLKF